MKGKLICCCDKMINAEHCRTKCPKGIFIKPDMFCEISTWEQENTNKYKNPAIK